MLTPCVRKCAPRCRTEKTLATRPGSRLPNACISCLGMSVRQPQKPIQPCVHRSRRCSRQTISPIAFYFICPSRRMYTGKLSTGSARRRCSRARVAGVGSLAKSLLGMMKRQRVRWIARYFKIVSQEQLYRVDHYLDSSQSHSPLEVSLGDVGFEGLQIGRPLARRPHPVHQERQNGYATRVVA
jgi:hypothetical protein